MTATADRVSRIFHAAIARPPEERLPFVAAECGGDDALKRELESLLARDAAAASFLERPAVEALAGEPADAARLAGTRLGTYEIGVLIGAGGMAEVYRARDIHLGRDVAIKILPPRFADDPARLARFEREARLLASLNHPRIATIHGLARVEAHLFLVLELVEGLTLAERLAAGPVAIDEALSLARQIAEALEAAHGRGIVHRDLKPTNVKITTDGSVKLLDFGLAKALVPTSADGERDGQISVSGLIVGTAAYMSPEQARGQAVDQRTDIWAFGCVLYELLTDRRAFPGDTASDVVAAVLTREPDWSALPASTPAPIRLLLRRCLEKSTARRVREIADARLEIEQTLESTVDAGSESTSTRRPKRARPATWVRWMFLPLVLLAGYVAWRNWPVPHATDANPSVPLTSLPGTEWHPSLSPDGNYLAFMWTGSKQDNPDIYVQQVGAGNPVRLTTDGRSDYNPVWSPDGRWIAFLRAPRLPPRDSSPVERSEVLLIPPLGGAERALGELRIRTVGTSAFLAWCPDSSCLIATNSLGEGQPDALFVLSLESGERRQLTHPPPSTLGDCNPAVSPDGRSLVFRRVPAGGAGELHRLTLGSGPTVAGVPERLTPGRLNAGYPAWMPDGDAILFSAQGRLWRMAMRGGTSPAPLPFAGDDGIMPVISRSQPGGRTRLVYVRSFSDRNIWRVDTAAAGAAASSSPVVAIASTRTETVGALSPDGRRVAFASDRSGVNEIWLADLDGANPVQLTVLGTSWSAGPEWSPDGRQIAFQSNRDGQFEIYVTAAAGGLPRRLTSDPANDHTPSFSRDGRWIYFGSTRRGGSTTGDYHVWKMPAHGGDAVQVTLEPGFRAVESLDGTNLYFCSPPGRAQTLWRMPTSGGPAIKLAEGIVSSAFAVVEKGIYYLDAPSGRTRLQFLDSGTERSTTVAENIGRVGPLLTASLDGRTILYTREESSTDDLMLVENFQ